MVKKPVHNPCVGSELRQQALQAAQRSETPPYRRAGTGEVRGARFARIPLGPLGQLGPPELSEFMWSEKQFSSILPGQHFSAVAPASVEPKLPPECWEAGQPGTLGSPPVPGEKKEMAFL